MKQRNVTLDRAQCLGPETKRNFHMDNESPEGIAARKRIVNRLKRANGQLVALIGNLEGGAQCRDVVTQLSAVSSALDRAGFVIVSTAMRDCAVDPGGTAEKEDGLTTEELEKLFLMLA